MKWVPDRLYNAYRKKFGRYELEDPRPTAADSPYTFYLPPPDHIDALRPGDIAKAVFYGHPKGRTYGAERMWVEVTGRDGDKILGTLDNQPFDMPQLSPGDPVTLLPHHIIDVDFQDKDNRPELEGLSRSKQKQYWDRCMVDDCVANGSVRVGYIYRETPDLTREDDKNPDSGWRIRGDVYQMSDDEYENGKALYIALGAVLNRDDSWIHLIDSPVGTAFLINQDTGEFEPTEFTAHQDNEDNND